jgi:hypothetical protein
LRTLKSFLLDTAIRWAASLDATAWAKNPKKIFKN